MISAGGNFVKYCHYLLSNYDYIPSFCQARVKSGDMVTLPETNIAHENPLVSL